MTTPAQVLAAARTELGYTEDPPGSNRTKFAAEAGHRNGLAWCATFVVAMFRRAGIRLPSESAGALALVAAMPQVRGGLPGDVVSFNIGTGHVGILESATSGTVTCIEGNTSPGTVGSQSNGGGVYRRTRSRSVVARIGRPAYAPPLTIPEAKMRVPNPVAAHRRPGTDPAQFAIIAKDGSMWAFNGAPWCDAYNAHPEWGGPTVRAAVGFEWHADGWGWTGYFDDGAYYSTRAVGH